MFFVELLGSYYVCDCYTNMTNACGHPQGGELEAMWTAADRGEGSDMSEML